EGGRQEQRMPYHGSGEHPSIRRDGGLMFFLERQRKRPRVFWTLAFIAALVLVINGTVFYSIRTSQALLDVELGKRLEGTAQIAALIVRPEYVRALNASVRDSAMAAVDSVSNFVVQMDAIEASDKVKAS